MSTIDQPGVYDYFEDIKALVYDGEMPDTSFTFDPNQIWALKDPTTGQTEEFFLNESRVGHFDPEGQLGVVWIRYFGKIKRPIDWLV